MTLHRNRRNAAGARQATASTPARPVLAALCALALTLAPMWTAALAEPAPSGQSADSLWVEDLAVFEEQLPKLHKNLFFKITPEEFAASINELRENLPNLKPHEIVVSLMRIVASVGDSHTMLSADYTGLLRKVPVLTEWFSDGLYIVGADSGYSHMLGRRVTGVGHKTIDEVAEAMKELIPHENASQLLNRTPAYLMIPEVLTALSITNSPDSAIFVLESAGGVSVAAWPAMSAFNWVSVLTAPVARCTCSTGVAAR